MEDVKRREEVTDEICDKCGSPLVMKWGKFGSFYSCSAFSKAKPVIIAAGPYKKDPKGVLKKVLKSFHFPMIVKSMQDDMTHFQQEVADAKEFAAAVALAQKAVGKKVTAEPVSCDFTKENFAAKPDLSAPGADEAPEEEFCDNCGRLMVLRNGPWGPFMSCPGYSDDPPCKTIRKLTQKVQSKPPVVLDEPCPKCGKPLLQRDGALWRVRGVLGLSEVQVRQAGSAGREVPQGWRRPGRAQDEAGTDVLWLRELSEVRFCFEPAAGERDLPEVRLLVSAGVWQQGRHLHGVPEQPRVPAQAAGRKKGQPAEVPTTPECTYQRLIGPPKPKAQAAETDATDAAVEAIAV